MSMELLSPAGDREALIAAVQAGADAVYLGGSMLNARASAGNFDAEGLKWACDYAHERGVRIHVTVNTLVKQRELSLVDEIAGQLADAGADAAIVQDLGVAARLSRLLPSLPLHASTQMALHNRQGAAFARDAGFARAVLARELPFSEIGACAREGIEIEAFVHGALCVCCSGQCLFSSLVGGRSGNRGQCAQPCRLPYRLSGEVKAQGYLLSPKDLWSIDQLSGLRDAGVASLKIEGRLKRPEYVSVVTRAYRQALDILEDEGEYRPDEDTREELAQIFNRGGFTRGYGPGLNDKELMSTRRPNHQGVEAGRMAAPGKIELSRDVEAADALVLRGSDGEDRPVRGLSGSAGQTVRSATPQGARPGDRLFRLVAERQMQEAREYTRQEHRSTLLTGLFRAKPDERASLTLSDGTNTVAVQTDEPVARAENKPSDPDRVRAQLEKTGGTPYEFLDLALQLDPASFLPASALNELRRRALSALAERRLGAARGCAARLKPAGEPVLSPAPEKPSKPLLRVQSGDWALLCEAEAWGADRLIFAPEDLTEEGLSAVRPDRPFSLALPPTCGAQALDNLADWAMEHREYLASTLIASAGQLSVDWPGALEADYSMNLANREALAYLSGQGVAYYTPSCELTAQEIREIEEAGSRRELLLYGRLSLMQLRHCPLRAQAGGRHDACRRCDALPPQQQLNAHRLVDRKEVAFPLRRVRAPEGCLIRVLNSAPLMLLKHLPKLPEAASWRLVLTDEAAEAAEAAVRLHRLALEGDPRPADHPLFALLPGNTTTGHYFRGVQ